MFASTSSMQFFTDSRRPTLWVSACTLDSGGCHSFGSNTAKSLKNDYVCVEVDMRDRSNPHIKKTFKEALSGQPYTNVCITGCCFRPQVLEQLAEKYNLSKVQHVYIVVPPWIIMNNLALAALEELHTQKGSYPITLLTTGLENNFHHCSIGLPSPILNPPKDKEIVPPNCYGLMYIRNLNVTSPPPIQLLLPDELVDSDDDEPPPPRDETGYLNRYFSQIRSISRVVSPEVLVISTNDSAENEKIRNIAERQGVRVQFIEKLTEEDFLSALKQISQKRGVLATNGAQTLFQAAILNTPFLYYANKPATDKFLARLLKSMPADLQQTAAVILGLSDHDEVLKNSEMVSRVNLALQGKIQEALVKYERVKERCIPQAEQKENSLSDNNRASLSENLHLYIKKIKNDPQKDTAAKRLKILIECLNEVNKAHKADKELDRIQADTFMYNDQDGKIVISNYDKLASLPKNQSDREAHIKANLSSFAEFINVFMWKDMHERDMLDVTEKATLAKIKEMLSSISGHKSGGNDAETIMQDAITILTDLLKTHLSRQEASTNSSAQQTQSQSRAQ